MPLRILALVALAWPAAAAANGNHSDPIAPVILGVTSILFFALLGRFTARKLGQPSVLGELLTGILLGNLLYFLGFDFIVVLREGTAIFDMVGKAMAGQPWPTAAGDALSPKAAELVLHIFNGPYGADLLHVAQTVDVFSRYGVIFMLFLVGLETSVTEMRAVGPDSLRVAVIGVVAPFALGLGAAYMLLPDRSLDVDLFVAATLCATSVGITARVLHDMGRIRSSESRVILGAAVIDDVLGLIMLAIVSGIIVSGSVDAWEILRTVVIASLFLVGAFALGPYFLNGTIHLLRRLDIVEAKLFISFLFVMILAWLANLAGLATIIGAFAAGLILHDGYFHHWHLNADVPRPTIKDLVAPLEAILAPIFFVVMGLQVKLETFLDMDVVLLSAGLLVAAIVGKLVSGLGARAGMQRMIVGAGMMPRGEVGLIFASIGKGLGVINDALFSSVILLVIVTTLVTPPLLNRLHR